MRSLSIIIAILALTLVSNAAQITNTFSFYATNVFAKSYDQNSLYAADPSNYKIYKMNYTRFPITVSYTYSTSQTKKIRVIGISRGEKYFATGSEDYTIQVVQGFTKTKVCTFMNLNQVRALIFDPFYEQILYSGSVDDAIRKYNITNCSMLVQKSVGGSVHSLDIDQDGKTLAFGTYQGHVGKIDSNLATFTMTSNAHRFTVLYIFYVFPGYYVSVGDDSRAILWNNGALINTHTSITHDKITTCLIIKLNQTYGANQKYLSCYTADSRSFFTHTITTSGITRFTTHGSSYTASWVDSKNMAGDQQSWMMNVGSSLISHQIKYTSSQGCNDGSHLARDLSDNTCKLCGYMLPGCHFCYNSSSCKTCGIGTYSSGGKCIKCSVECATCSSGTNCNICAVGYQPNGSSGKCVPQINTACCYECALSTSKCNTPGNGYFVNSGSVCKPCNQFYTACMECTNSATPSCTTCKTGYYINGSSCSSCNSFMPGCLACANKDTCLKCTVAFKWVSGFKQCSNCYGTCQTCLQFYDQCSSCYLSQNRQLIGQQCLCKQTYYDVGSGNYTCNLCSSVLTYCHLCDNNTICTMCKTNYYLTTSGGKTQCQVCNKYCQTCNGTSNNCTSCNSITYHRQLSGSTCVCSVGYISINGSIPCMPCDKIDDGCVTCINQTYCTLCDNGYYLKNYSSTNKVCQLCPYYCTDCSVNGSGIMVCNSCPIGTHRTLVNGNCTCDIGYFDDNRTLICQRCADVLTNCLTCASRYKCTSCGPGMFTDPAQSLCAPCRPTCLSCGAYFDQCATCDPTTNRVLSNKKCVCQPFAYQEDGVCKLCSDAIPNCNSCQNPYLCTGCDNGFTLQQDLKGCINCQAQINGCLTCTSTENCTVCKNPFSLINQKCRCPIDQYTSKQSWGSCKSYGIPGLKSSLRVQLEAHQHQNNTLIVFIRFRAKTLYVLNKKVEQSITLSINGVSYPINFDYIQNNHVKVSTQITEPMQKPNVTVTFLLDVFYNENLLSLAKVNQTVVPTRLYLYGQSQIKSYESVRQVLKYMFLIFKWIFFGLTIIGQGHLLFPFATFIQLIPLFLMFRMSLPANLSMALDGMLSFQVKSIVPMMNIKSDFFVVFPPMTYDYYGLYDFFLFGKIGDLLLLVFVNVMTKFDEGIVRMFPPGRIRRYLYESLVRRGYAVMSLCILSLQPSFILLAGVYITYDQWESSQQIFNYCSCVFIFGFYLAYNFNHASNLQGTKLMKNIQNQQCFLGINSQQPTAARTTLIVLATDFWIIGSLHLVSPMIYFTTCIIFLTLRIIVHIKRDYFIGRIQFGLRTLSNIFVLAIYCIMFVFYLGQNQIYIGFAIANILGLVTTALIFAYLLFHIIEKVLYNLKLEADFIETKVVQGANGQQVVFAKQNGEDDQEVKGQENDNVSTKSQKMKQFFNNTSTNGNNGFSGLDFRNKHQNKNQAQTEKQDSINPIDNNNLLGTSYYDGKRNNEPSGTTLLPNKSDAFFNGNGGDKKNFMQKSLRIKSANTSKYAKNHLQLRYKAQNILTKQPDRFDQ